jgi:hypothetical protein
MVIGRVQLFVLALSVLAGVVLVPLATGKGLGAVDFANGHGFQFQMQEKTASSFEVSGFSLICTSTTYIQADSAVKVSASGAFSYSGSATLFSGTNPNFKKTKTEITVSGTVHFGATRTLASAKSATAEISASAHGCKDYSGKLTGAVVPPGSSG